INEKASLEYNLKLILDPIPLEFRKENDNSYIILFPAKNKVSKGGLGSIDPPVTMEPSMEMIKISGIVTDESGNPLVGASVAIENSNYGTITNELGEYELLVDESMVSGQLIISYIGYLSRTVDYLGNQTINVSLAQNPGMIDEVII